MRLMLMLMRSFALLRAQYALLCYLSTCYSINVRICARKVNLGPNLGLAIADTGGEEMIGQSGDALGGADTGRNYYGRGD
jgi:hypothetical protein